MELQDQLAWLFAAEYAEKYGNLPPSQQREALKRLTARRRNPLSAEQCREPNPDIAAVLEAVYNAYNNKKLRSKASSATRRAALSNACVDAEPEADVACAEADSPLCHDTADTPADIVCAALVQPEVVQAPVRRARAPCIPPVRAPRTPPVPVAATPPAATPPTAVPSTPVPVATAAVPKTMPKKAVSGLAAMLAR